MYSSFHTYLEGAEQSGVVFVESQSDDDDDDREGGEVSDGGQMDGELK